VQQRKQTQHNALRTNTRRTAAAPFSIRAALSPDPSDTPLRLAAHIRSLHDDGCCDACQIEPTHQFGGGAAPKKTANKNLMKEKNTTP
jgi:hypothetical protein